MAGETDQACLGRDRREDRQVSVRGNTHIAEMDTHCRSLRRVTREKYTRGRFFEASTEFATNVCDIENTRKVRTRGEINLNF